VVDLALACERAAASAPAVVITPRAGASVPVCVRYPISTGSAGSAGSAGAVGAVGSAGSPGPAASAASVVPAKPSGEARACILATGVTRLPLPEAKACPAWLVGNADGRGYYHVHGALGAPPARRPAEQLAEGQDRAAALARGELTGSAAIGDVRALLATGDPYAELSALAIAAELDALIAEPNLEQWHAWLATRFARRLTRVAVWSAATPIERALRDAVTALVPGERFDATAIRAARRHVDRALAGGAGRIRAEELALALALAAPAGGRALFDKVVTAAVNHPTYRDEWLAGLGAFGPALAPRAVALVFDDAFDPVQAWAAVEGMLARPATRTAAWHAIHARFGELVTALEITDAHLLIDATIGLCDPRARDEATADFIRHLPGLATGQAATRAVEAIQRCIDRRRTVGALAGALR
jgi:alanyl aminopeptidase